MSTRVSRFNTGADVNAFRCEKTIQRLTTKATVGIALAIVFFVLFVIAFIIASKKKKGVGGKGK